MELKINFLALLLYACSGSDAHIDKSTREREINLSDSFAGNSTRVKPGSILVSEMRKGEKDIKLYYSVDSAWFYLLFNGNVQDVIRYNWDIKYLGLNNGIKIDNSYKNVYYSGNNYVFVFNDFDRYILLLFLYDPAGNKFVYEDLFQSISSPFEIIDNTIFASDGYRSHLKTYQFQ